MKEFVTWNVIDEAVTDIAFNIKNTNKDFKGVYGIPRGGLILAVMLSHKLDIPLIMSVDELDENSIIIDDIADTGKTLLDFVEYESYVVTIHEHEQSLIKPDYSVIDKGDKWIVYPWETEDSEEIQDYLK
jgi:hypoxanthine phosphoribosyltransferase|tara:strand:+ start:104 stop:493 length:390 start_codon:yes stop_codon:yes gene_type:complete